MRRRIRAATDKRGGRIRALRDGEGWGTVWPVMTHTTQDTHTRNGYVCFYRGQRKEVFAATLYQAQQIAAGLFRAKKSYDVSVMLAEKNGQQVTHVPSF